MLDRAQAYLRKTLSILRTDIDAGLEFVVLEPACAAVFRDEMVNLFPGDETAKRLSKQTHFFGEFVERRLSALQLAPLDRRAVVHTHCHQKAIAGADVGKATLTRAGLDVALLDSGCCGMGGSFGFEKGKYEISTQIGELVLLPAVRAAAADTLIVADGFSCREQIAQCAGRKALHLAEVLHMSLASARESPAAN
jgi:Fe-S oxidoreductase